MKQVELYAQVRYAVQIEGLSERAAARRFGIDPRTVAKMMRFSVPPGYRRTKPPVKPKLDAFIAPMGVAQNAAALVLAKELRAAGLAIEVGDGSFRLKKSFEAADKLARRIVIMGEDEVSSGILTVKDFSASAQTKVSRADLADFLRG